MNRHGPRLMLLFASTLALFVSCSHWPLSETATARQGVLDLSRASNPLVSTQGEWEYYPDALLYPVDFEQRVHAAAAAVAPFPGEVGSWTKARGYGTYRLTVLDHGASGYGGILVPSIGSAMELWVDGTAVARTGRVGTTAASEIPNPDGILALFPLSQGRTELVLQVSDFHGAAVGQAPAPLLLGSARAVSGYEAMVRGLETAILAVLALSWLLLLIRYLGKGRFEEYRPLLVAVLCLAGVLRQLTIDGVPSLSAASPIFGSLPWPMDVRSQLFGYFFLFFAYLLTFFGRERAGIYRILLRTLLGLSVLAVLGSLVLPVPLFGRFAVGAGALFALGFFVFLLRGLGVLPGRGGERLRSPVLMTVGSAVLFIAAADGVLVYARLSPVGYVGPIAIFLYVVIWWVNEQRAGVPAAAHAPLRSGMVEEVTEELRRPLHGIVGLAESLLSGRMGELADDQVVSLSLIAASGLRLSNAVEDLSDRAGLLRHALVLDRTAVAVEPLIDRVGEHLKPLMLVRSVELKNELPPELPEVDGDRRRVERIFYNLVAEGLSTLEHGAIVVGGRAADSTVEFFVRADGEAASAAREPHKVPGGAGERGKTGREIATELIRLHGGRFTAGAGTSARYEVSFSLPRAKERVEGPRQIAEQLIRLDAESFAGREAEEGPNGPSRGGLRILVADDDLMSLQTMRNYLLKEHFRVGLAYDGEEVLRQVESAPPDLLLVASRLPKIDGFEICRRLRKTYTPTELPILILIDAEQSGNLVEGMTAGASDFISKPITPDEFLARVKTHVNLAKINTLYSRFVPVELLHFLGRENVVDLQLGDQIQREMTILFVDIRAFTSLSEGMTPEENFKFINSYLSRITPIIRENNGFIDKYIGDAILALYPGSPEDALRSAIRMVDYLQEYNGYRRNSGYRPINIGIGIHTGNLIVGIIGDTDRMQGTVISDAVNLASRVQDVTKLYGANIIISQDTFVRMENPTDYNFRFLGKVKVKGKDQTVSLFEVFDGEPPEHVALKNRTKKDFEEAILMFSQRKFAEAAQAFRKIVVEDPVDRAATLFLNRSEFFLRREKANWLMK